MIVEKSIHQRIDAETQIRVEFDKLGLGPLNDIKSDNYPDW